MLYPVLIKTIERGEYDPIALQETLDELFASGRMTSAQYEKATAMLQAAEQLKEETKE